MNARSVRRKAMALVAAALLAGCGAAAAPTPQIIYVTPAPTETPAPIPSPTAAPTPTSTSSPSATAEPTPTVEPTETPSPRASEADTGAWEVSEITADPISGKPKATAVLIASSGKNAFGKPIALAIRCSEEKTDVLILWGDYLTSDDRVIVTTRLGEGAASDDYWETSSNNTITFFPGPDGDHIAYAKALFGESRLVARITPYNANQVTAIFDLAGIENAVVNVRKACEW